MEALPAPPGRGDWSRLAVVLQRVIFVGGEEEEVSEWLVMRMAFVLMFFTSTGVSTWLFIVAFSGSGS